MFTFRGLPSAILSKLLRLDLRSPTTGSFVALRLDGAVTKQELPTSARSRPRGCAIAFGLSYFALSNVRGQRISYSLGS